MRTPSTAPTASFGLEPAGYRTLLEQFAHASRILVYSGAGMSADSGLPTYRGAGQHLWTGDLLERVATPTGYADVLSNVRTPHKVSWPVWWEAHLRDRK